MSTASIWVKVRFEGEEHAIVVEETHVAGLRNAVKKQMKNRLTGTDAVDLVVYRNEAAYDKGQGKLKGHDKLEGSEDDANFYIVVVPAKEVDEGKQLQSK
jgi:hypothetical protein